MVHSLGRSSVRSLLLITAVIKTIKPFDEQDRYQSSLLRHSANLLWVAIIGDFGMQTTLKAPVMDDQPNSAEQFEILISEGRVFIKVFDPITHGSIPRRWKTCQLYCPTKS